MPRCPPFLKRPSVFQRTHEDDAQNGLRRPWTTFLAPGVLVILILLPQPSWVILLSSPYVGIHLLPLHLAITTILTLLSLNSLAICCFRDPGRPKLDDLDSNERNQDNLNTLRVDHVDEEDEALLNDDEEEDPNDFNSARKWCRTCWAPKPDRTHHCSSCGRCVLRMDHHCPWVGQCVGHRTHTAFLHLLACISLLALYIGVLSAMTMYGLLFGHAGIGAPLEDTTPLHCLFLVVMGLIIALIIGSFFLFHIYLCITNQTTLEQLSPFTLLKYLPKAKDPRHAPGTSITATREGLAPSVVTRNVHIPDSDADANANESPYYFPSPPPTPPAQHELLDSVRNTLLASNPLSTIPGSGAGSPSRGSDVSASKVFSASPVATTQAASGSFSRVGGFHEWDEDSLSFHQRYLVRKAAEKFGIWDLGWRKNLIATLGSGDPSSRRRGRSRPNDGTGRLSGSSSRTKTGRGSEPYTLMWWLSVLLNGGPPRGDGKTFPRNPKSRAALLELRGRLEESERRDRGEAREQPPYRQYQRRSARRESAPVEEVELQEV